MFVKRSAKILVLAILLTFAIDTNAQKMTPEEVVAKHLDSIGAADKRAAIKNQLIVSDVKLEGTGRAGVYGGKGIIFSAPDKNVWGMNLNIGNTEPDRFGYNGKSTRAGFIRPGFRSAIGNIVLRYNKLVEESLLGGTLSNSWVLLNVASKKPKLSYDGTKKIDGKETVVLSYTPKGGSEMNIKIFFDGQTFQHVRTEYSIYRAAALGSINTSAGRDSTRERLVETFSDFRDMGGLKLPGTYKIAYSAVGGSSVQIGSDALRDFDYTFTITNFSFNQAADEKAFDIDIK